MEFVDFSKYNDYELIYLHHECDENATNILITKYSFLINSEINKLSIPSGYKDNYFAVGYQVLLKALNEFNELSRMSFCSFFKKKLKYALINEYHREKKNYNLEHLDDYDEFVDTNTLNSESFLDYLECEFSPLEERVYQEILKGNYKSGDIAKELGENIKCIYNARRRIILKMKRLKK